MKDGDSPLREETKSGSREFAARMFDIAETALDDRRNHEGMFRNNRNQPAIAVRLEMLNALYFLQGVALIGTDNYECRHRPQGSVRWRMELVQQPYEYPRHNAAPVSTPGGTDSWES